MPPPPPPPPRRKNPPQTTPPPTTTPPPVPIRTAAAVPPPFPSKNVGFKPPPPPPKRNGPPPPPVPANRRRGKSRISRISASGKRSSAHSRKIRGRRVGKCRWMKRNWILLTLAGLALAGFILAGLLYFEPCPLIEQKTKVTTLSPVDVVFLLDASGSMSGSPWLKQAEAASLMLTTLMTSSNHTTNGTFQASVVQWSGDSRYDPGTSPIFIDQSLSNNVTEITKALDAPLPQTLSSWTFFSPALVECQKQLNASKQPDSYKLCILMTDGINNDNVDYIYPSDAVSGVGRWCVDQNITSKSVDELDLCVKPSDDVNARPGAPPANSCTSCVESQDSHCASNPWDDTCMSGCLAAACAPSCKGVCTTANIADKLHGAMDIKMAGVLVSGGIAASKLEAATNTVKQVSSCKNETELAMGKCPFFVEADDFDELTAKATTIADALASEILAETSEKSAFVCLGSPEFLSLLVLAFPLLFYLLYKPSSFAVRKAAHNMKAPPPLPPRMTVAMEKAEEEVIEPEIVVMEEEDEIEVESPPPGSPPKVAVKRYKWDIQSNDKYLWANEKGLGHMPVDYSTKTLGNSLPPSAPKDQDLTKGKKVLREALHWETADKYEQQQLEEVIRYEEEEEELEVRLSNIYNGDDVAEAIADAVIDNVVDPIGKYLCCGYCCGGFCGLCGCLDRTFCCCCGEDEEDDDFSRASGSTRGTNSALEGGGGGGHVAMKAIV
ncbi:hypothetical protein TrVE_jg7732 [Triparma verrucosa]|uniref:VWFA domain-containing protein n=1 Tax=Triparma verrucosa TaxID=1606542 RepID=A0A9W7EKG8_9STRA|nr:hypothetical protein TrVE_jg7732 [Triparma verrucosa]